MNKIDAHQHFWQFDPVRDNWITDDMSVIQKDFLPDDLKPVLKNNSINGTVAVQASQSESETTFLISLSEKYDFIKAVVGWIDFQADDIMEMLAKYKTFPIVKGFRHVLQGELQRDLMLQPFFKKGIAALQPFGFTYDLLILPDQLKFCIELVAAFPEQKFVIDHIAKPNIKNGEIEDWQHEIKKIAAYPNVYCKISAMTTEADWKTWKQQDFEPYLDVIVNAFGTRRIMFGSDWPVCLVAGSYEQTLGIVTNYFSTFSKEDQQQFFGLNAINFYDL
ncbi:MAG: amidohydrolase family protein [Ferruginibacter sp.]